MRFAETNRRQIAMPKEELEGARGLKIFRLTAGQTRAFEGRERRPGMKPDYGVLVEGIEEALRKHMVIVFSTSSISAVHELARRTRDKVWIVENLGPEAKVDGPSGEHYTVRGNYKIMECWGL